MGRFSGWVWVMRFPKIRRHPYRACIQIVALQPRLGQWREVHGSFQLHSMFMGPFLHQGLDWRLSISRRKVEDVGFGGVVVIGIGTSGLECGMLQTGVSGVQFASEIVAVPEARIYNVPKGRWDKHTFGCRLDHRAAVTRRARANISDIFRCPSTTSNGSQSPSAVPAP